MLDVVFQPHDSTRRCLTPCHEADPPVSSPMPQAEPRSTQPTAAFRTPVFSSYPTWPTTLSCLCPFTFALTHFASTPLFYFMPRIPLPLIPRSCLSGSSQRGSTIRWPQNFQEPQPERLPTNVVHQIGRGSGAKLFRRADADCCKPSHVPSLDRCAVTYPPACMYLLCMAPRSRANGMVCFWIPRSVFVLP